MGLLGSALGRGVAGAAAGGADYLSKYIDNDLQMQKAQALADLQRKTAGAIREDDDAFRNDPTRVSRDRGNKVADITAEGGARNAVALQGKVDEATNTELTAGQVAREKTMLADLTPAKIDAANAFTAGTSGVNTAAEVARQKALLPGEIAKARATESSATGAAAALSRFQLGLAQKLGSLQDTLADAITTGNKGLEEQTRERIGALSGKDGKATEFYKIAENASRAMASAQKILADSMTSPEAKDDAKQTIREQRALMYAAAKHAGVDLTQAQYEKPTAASIAALQKDPSKAADFDGLFGPGAAAKVVGAVAPKVTAPVVSRQPMAAVETPPTYLNDTAKAQWLLDKPARDQAEIERKRAEVSRRGRALMDAASRAGAYVPTGD